MMANELEGDQITRPSKSPYCNRQFCVQCKAPWHAGIKCEEYFQNLNKDERKHGDITLMKLAKNRNWKRCPNCRYFVDKKDGCMYII
ncbi:hypothetical protein ACOSP7_002615 [Xanthoceras sorbifolium]